MRGSTVGGVLLGLVLVVAAPSPAAAALPASGGDDIITHVCERVDLRVPGPGIRFLEPALAAVGFQISPLAHCGS